MTAAGRSVETEIQAEQRYVDRVYARLDELVERAREIGRDGQSRGRLDYTGEIKEDDYRGLFERDVMVDHAVRRLALLDAQRDGLVFGRLDQQDGAVRYVGRLGIRDEDQEPLVVDWRAPAAAVFYQATAVQPMGVVRRRVLRSLGQQVIGVEDDLLDADAPAVVSGKLHVVGDGALMAALTAARGTQMRDIVATIQREQDEIIRAPSRGAILITGGPGTGKTVVALHRAAYLLYSERQRMARGGILVVGPSPVFMTYIERVLPSLGEHDATLRALGEVHDGIVATRLDPYEVGVVKGSLRMRTVLQRVVRATPPGAPTELRIYAAGRILRLDEGELTDIRRRLLTRSARHNASRREAARRVLEALWRKTDPGEVERGDFDEDVAEREEFLAFMNAWWPFSTPTMLFDRLRNPELFARHAKGILRPAEISLLTSTWGETPSVQDVPLIDELYALLGPVPAPPPVVDELEGVFDEFLGDVGTLHDQVGGSPVAQGQRRSVVETSEQYDNYAHILVDEAQDLSPMQWRMLGRRGERASWTIVGDPAQSARPDLEESDKAREQALGKRLRQTFRLSTNYRNSAEIFELAHRIIRHEQLDLDLPKAVRHTGVEPVENIVAGPELPDAVRSAVVDVLAAVEGTVGVVAPLARRPELESWVEDIAHDRLSLLTPLATKGLEYDGMVVVLPEEIAAETPVGFRTLYVVLTRATQRLVTIGLDGRWLAERAAHPAYRP